eukprot:521816_1
MLASIVEKSTLNPNAVPFVPAQTPSKYNSKSAWFPVANIPQSILNGDCVMLNNHEILVVSEKTEINLEDRYDDDAIHNDVLYKYNVHRNEWNVFINCDLWRLDDHAIAFDGKSNTLYLADEWRLISVIDMKSKTVSTSVFTGGRCPSDPILINANGVIHKIGGYRNAQHLIWNNDKNELDEMHDFDEEEGIFMIYAASAVYVASKGIILMFGGAGEPKDELESSFEMISDIWKYCIATNEWQKVKGINFEYYGHSTALSSNEAYIVIAGGCDKYRNVVDTIHALDIRDDNNYVLRKCSIKCPMSGRHKIVRSGGGLKDQLLVTWSLKSLSLDIRNLIQRGIQRQNHCVMTYEPQTNYNLHNDCEKLLLHPMHRCEDVHLFFFL